MELDEMCMKLWGLFVCLFLIELQLYPHSILIIKISLQGIMNLFQKDLQ